MISLTSPVRTRAHGWPAPAKLIGLSAATFALFMTDDFRVHLGAAIAVLGVYRLGGEPFFRHGLKALWVLWPFVAIVIAWHLLTQSAGEGAVICLRMISAVGLANLVTMTTPLSAMIDVLHRLLRPLRALGVPSEAVEMAAAMVIRFTPVLLDKARLMLQSWAARSRRRPNWRVILPIALLALDDADHVAEALRARGGLNPTKGT